MKNILPIIIEKCNKNEFLATINMILSCLFYSLQYLDVKVSGSYYGSWTITFFRGLSGIVSAIAFIKIMKIFNIDVQYFGKPEYIKKLIFRGLIGGSSLICAFIALRYLNMSIAVVLTSTSPIWTGIFSYFYNKDVWKCMDTIASLIGILGIILISYYGFDSINSIIGFILALVGALLQAGVHITIYDIKDESTAVISLYSMIGCLIISLPGFIYEQHNKIQPIIFNLSATKQLLQLFLTGFLSFIAQSFRTTAIQQSKGLGIVVIRNLTVLFSLLWDIILLHSKIDYITILGIILIVLGCFINKIF
jgi:drug/metabolite transporter (DMT)-like permease